MPDIRLLSGWLHIETLGIKEVRGNNYEERGGICKRSMMNGVPIATGSGTVNSFITGFRYRNKAKGLSITKNAGMDEIMG